MLVYARHEYILKSVDIGQRENIIEFRNFFRVFLFFVLCRNNCQIRVNTIENASFVKQSKKSEKSVSSTIVIIFKRPMWGEMGRDIFVRTTYNLRTSASLFAVIRA